MRHWILLLFVGMLLSGCAASSQQNTAPREAPETMQAASSDWALQEAALMTRWADDVSPESVQERPYPRPQMRRERWKNLNGLWEYTFEGEEPPIGQPLDSTILVPFPVESALSGVMKRTPDSDRFYYRRTFEVPANWEEERTLLHFGAVDWDATVYVNGEEVGRHRGGYDPFTLDITEALSASGPQELVVEVYDPTSEGNQARGKQVKDPRGIWYTPVSGIWQTVWLEPVPQHSISEFKLVPDIDREVLRVKTSGRGRGVSNYEVEAVAKDEEGEIVGQATGSIGEEMAVPVPDPQLWWPRDPYLYDLTLRLKEDDDVVDEVDSYFGMRKVEVAEDEEGTPRIMVNDEFIFQVGPLDQGYWPDGLYTAPTDDALRYDLEVTKQLGFNMSRKHVKVEPARWYYWADKMGLLVWQDMPNADNETPESKKQFERELKELVDDFYNHPSIISWVVFNEGWGQYEAERLTKQTEEWDPSRPIVDASGWQHVGAGDIIDVHRYQGPAAVEPIGDRASIVGEFGGLGHVVEDHTWAGEGWGYQGTLETPQALLERYELLLKRLWHSKNWAGMSGGIYTQTTDVEREINGLMTYDRDVIKMGRDRVSAVNKGITPYILPDDHRFIDSTRVRIVNWADDTTIRYTRDDSQPTASSPRFQDAFVINSPTTVRAQAFRGGEPIGPVSVAAFEQVPGRAPSDVSEAELEQGLRYRYFEGAAEQRDKYAQHWPLRRQVAQGDVLEAQKTGTIERFTLTPKERDELFAFEYEGYVQVPRTGVYTFSIHADDGTKFLVGGEQVNNRAGQSPRTAIEKVRVPLQAGLHPIELRHFQAYGPSELEVYIEGPGLAKQAIPSSMLYWSSSQAGTE